MNLIKSLVAALAVISGGLAANAQPASSAKTPADAPADSVSMAIATVWADYMQPQIKAGSDDYKRGIMESFGMPADRQAYYRGVYEGMAIKSQLSQMENFGYKIDWTLLTTFLEKALKGETTGFTPATADAYLSSFIGEQSPVKATSSEAEKEFLDSHASAEGAVTTPSGLVFEVITEGEGPMPPVQDKVKVRYTGRLSDGTVFDETKGEPVIFPVGSLIPGFTEGLTMMKPGGTYRLFIPSSLGYGERGAGKVIPPGAVLDFTVELLDIIPAP